nr:ribonuclease H-like domain-containing protein [Tanacetum cinerariifolium]
MDAKRIKAPRKRTRKEKVEKDQTAKKQKGNELEKDNAKKKKLEEQPKAKELKRNLEIITNDEDDVFVNVAPLSSKPPTIMDYKIYKEGEKEHFQIIIANGNHQMYLAFNTMLKKFNREDLKVLWKIVKDRFKKSQPKEVLDVFLWQTLKNDNSFKPVPRTTANADGTSTSTIPGLVTTEEKAQKKNDVQARSMLLMALPNEHLLTFSQYTDAKTLFEAIQARFSGNDTSNKTQRTLLKQMFENFNAPSTDLPSEWNTHVVVWRNEVDLDTMSIDDLCNNFKIIEQEVKRTVTSSSSSGSQNMAFLSSPSSTNEVDTASIQVSTVSTPVSIVSSYDNTTNLSDTTMYAFLANQPNGSQLVHEDLKQIHEDDLEEMDLKWQLALLSMRARRNPRNQESMPRNQDSSRKTVNVEDTSFKAMVAIDEAGFDLSDMADDEVPTNMALMAFSDSERNIEYPRALLHRSIPQDMRTTTKHNGVTTSFQHRQTQYHMLIFKLQRHIIGLKDSRNQESSEQIKTKTFLEIQKTINTSRKIVSFQDDARVWAYKKGMQIKKRDQGFILPQGQDAAMQTRGIRNSEGPEMDAKRIKAPRKRTRKEKVEKDQTAKKQKGNELEKDNAKKQKLEEQPKAKELKRNLEIITNDEDDVFVNVAPLSSKPPTIMDYKIYKEGEKEHFQIIIANGNHQMYLAFNTMLKKFNREDLKVLWKIVKDRFKKSQPKEVLDVFLWQTLKV